MSLMLLQYAMSELENRESVQFEHIPLLIPEEYGNPISVCGEDTRRKVTETGYFPFRYICHLRSVFATRSGSKATAGTGFFTGRRAVITAGHCVYSAEYGWATNVTV